MKRHPLDDCEPAKRLRAMAEEETKRTANKLVNIPNVDLASAIDQVFGDAQLELTPPFDIDTADLEWSYDQDTETLHVTVKMVVPVVVDNIKLQLKVASIDPDHDD